MADEMSSRERMLAALNGKKPDHIPLAFMIFTALEERLEKEGKGGDQAAFIEAQMELGLDTVGRFALFCPAEY